MTCRWICKKSCSFNYPEAYGWAIQFAVDSAFGVHVYPCYVHGFLIDLIFFYLAILESFWMHCFGLSHLCIQSSFLV